MERQARGPAQALLVARCGQLKIGVPALAIRKVVAAPRTLSLPDMPAVVAGIIDLHGAPLIVLDLARRGAAAGGAITLDSRIAVLSVPGRSVGLLCDAVEGVRPIAPAEAQALSDFLPRAGYPAALPVGDGSMILLFDPEDWLSGSTAEAVDAALRQLPAAAPEAPP